MSRLWRLARRPFSDLSGTGASLYGGRWNSPGLEAVYLAAEPSLAVLEVRVHLDIAFDRLPKDYVLIAIDAGQARGEDGPTLVDEPECRAFGDDWLRSRRSALLRVPSVIVPEAANVILNPRHEDALMVTIRTVRDFRFDRRLFG